MTLMEYLWRHVPLAALRFLIHLAGGFQTCEELGFVNRAWYVNGPLSAADHTRKVGYDKIWAPAFGVTAGRGQRTFDTDRGVWNLHRRIGPQVWFERMFILHVFDHAWRSPRQRDRPKIIAEY